MILSLSTIFLSFPTPLLGIVPLAGLGASTSACLVSLASSIPRSTEAGLIALALVPMLVSIGIVVAVSPALEVGAAAVLFSVALISGSPTGYVIAKLNRRLLEVVFLLNVLVGLGLLLFALFSGNAMSPYAFVTAFVLAIVSGFLSRAVRKR